MFIGLIKRTGQKRIEFQPTLTLRQLKEKLNRIDSKFDDSEVYLNIGGICSPLINCSGVREISQHPDYPVLTEKEAAMMKPEDFLSADQEEDLGFPTERKVNLFGDVKDSQGKNWKWGK